jgi:hypothetical protein
MFPMEITIPTGEQPTLSGMMDKFTQFMLDNSMTVAVVIMIAVVVIVGRIAGGAIVSILGKFALPIGIVVIVAAFLGVKMMLG